MIDPSPPRMHPVSLGLRFVLEFGALAALALWGKSLGAGLLGTVAAPAAAVLAWSTLTVPGDPSRGDRGSVRVPGWVRLALEAAVFSLAVGALVELGWPRWAVGLGAGVVLHYASSWRRLRWLWQA